MGLMSDTILVGLRLIFIDKPDRGAFFSSDSCASRTGLVKSADYQVEHSLDCCVLMLLLLCCSVELCHTDGSLTPSITQQRFVSG